ncbi:MAG: hypothetical protein KJ737_13610 [Proteobacteria bacterium]|nr:hypothetical protein [Pseudomonadota bacterium]
MGSFKKLMGKMKIPALSLIAVFCLTALISFGCSSSSGGGGGDDEGDGGSTNSIVGVWELKSVTEDCGSGDVVPTELPYDTGFGIIGGYVKLTASTQLYYISLSNVTPLLGEDGIYYCAESEESYTMSGNTITGSDGSTGTFEISGDTLTLVTQDVDEEGCTSTLVLKKASESDISGAKADCDLFEQYGLLSI